jgi:hypothetical protein
LLNQCIIRCIKCSKSTEDQIEINAKQSRLKELNPVPLVITTCTNRKRKPVPYHLQMRALSPAQMAGVAADWCGRLRKAVVLHPAAEIYGGRGFREAEAAASLLDARLMVVSAGLGLIDAARSVPPYASTILPGAPDGVPARVTGGFSASGWWAALSVGSPFSISLRRAADDHAGLILAALSDAYIDMVSADLLSLPGAARSRLRLFTRASIERVPSGLRPYVMPYDDRLDGPDSRVQGTLGDFASRALHHFAKNIALAQDTRSASEHAAAVEGLLDGQRAPEKIRRVRYDDATMLDLIRSSWDDPEGRSLRRFRDEFNVACEQGRFRALSSIVRAERA